MEQATAGRRFRRHEYVTLTQPALQQKKSPGTPSEMAKGREALASANIPPMPKNILHLVHELNTCNEEVYWIRSQMLLGYFYHI